MKADFAHRLRVLPVNLLISYHIIIMANFDFGTFVDGFWMFSQPSSSLVEVGVEVEVEVGVEVVVGVEVGV